MLTRLGIPPTKLQRPLANPDLFKPSTTPTGSRTASSQNGPQEGADVLHPGSTVPSKLQTSNTKSSKWQPLSTIDPSPVAENDPFSLGDSDDDREVKAKDSKPAVSEGRQRDNTAALRDEDTKEPGVRDELEKKS
jgi:hypothetical protein